MTVTCRAPYCSATPRLSVSELFERGHRRNRTVPLPIEGEPCTGPEGLGARFSLALDGERITGVGFRASMCATLIAYCELIAELATGSRFDIVRSLTAANLVESLPGVPPLKRDRAVLAAAAFRAALTAASSTRATIGSDR